MLKYIETECRRVPENLLAVAREQWQERLAAQHSNNLQKHHSRSR